MLFVWVLRVDVFAWCLASLLFEDSVEVCEIVETRFVARIDDVAGFIQTFAGILDSLLI